MKNGGLLMMAVTTGLLLILVAIFAGQIGLDHNDAWGRGRTTLLVAGALVLTACAAAPKFARLQGLIAGHRPSLKLAFTRIALTLFGLTVLLTYAWFASSGRWTYWGPTTNYYDRLAQAFRQGHLYLESKFIPDLIALPDPYEPDARRDIVGLGDHGPERIWDMSLYDGKLYLYWGPAPAVLLAVAKTLYGGQVGDQVLTFGFVAGLFVFQFLILLMLWRRYFQALPVWLALSACLFTAFINPVPWILTIPRIYEAAIAADEFFLMGGLFFALSGLDRSVPSIWRLVLAGFLFSLSVASRVTMAPAVVFMAAMVLYRLWRGPSTKMAPSRTTRAATGFALPLLAGGLALAWYNQARFDSVFESGLRYAITMINQNNSYFYNLLFSSKYILANLYLYLFNPPGIIAEFPFIKPLWNGEFISAYNLHHQTIYNAERIVGLVYTTPFSLFALIPAATAALSLAAGIRPSQGDPVGAGAQPNGGILQWLLLCLLGALILEASTVALIFYGTMRYFMDISSTLALLSSLGFWMGYQALAGRPTRRAWYVAIGVMLTGISVGVSLLLAFSGDVGRFRANNPNMLAHWKLFFVHLLNYLGR